MVFEEITSIQHSSLQHRYLGSSSYLPEDNYMYVDETVNRRFVKPYMFCYVLEMPE